LVFVLDVAGSEGRAPLADLGALRRELSLYDPKLSERPWMIVANKMDLPGAEENLRLLQNRFADRAIVPVAAERGDGVAQLKDVLGRLLVEERRSVTEVTVPPGTR